MEISEVNAVEMDLGVLRVDYSVILGLHYAIPRYVTVSIDNQSAALDVWIPRSYSERKK